MIFIIGGREQGKTAYAMKLWEKRTLERRKTKDLSTVLNRSKNPEACRVTARIADGRLETDEQTILQADLMEAFERDYRETDGRICQRIAAYSEEVHRVICGLGMRIK